MTVGVRPVVIVEDGRVHVAGPSIGLDHYEVVGLIGDLTAALMELWPDAGSWQSDPNREDNSGRIGKSRANKRRE